MYRTDLRDCQGTNGCENAAWEEGRGYGLGIVEIDDQGWLWSTNQLQFVLGHLSPSSATNGTLVVAFVHGWKHGVKYDDTNLEMFRDNLRALATLEHWSSNRESRPERKVVGAYIGWRGLSSSAPILKELTFWGRKNIAHEVGRGALTEVLTLIDNQRFQDRQLHPDRKKPSELVIIGHSFGGAAVYSALAPLLIQNIDESSRGKANVAPGIGDLVVLINPAFEASKYAVLRQTAMLRTFPSNQPVRLAIFTSKTDDATKVAFPLGRTVSTLFDRHQSSFERKASITAVGHFAPFTTHDLDAKSRHASKEVKKAQAEQPMLAEKSQETLVTLKDKEKKPGHNIFDTQLEFSRTVLTPREGIPQNSPLLVGYVASAIIPDHNKIDSKEFKSFLSEFLFLQENKH